MMGGRTRSEIARMVGRAILGAFFATVGVQHFTETQAFVEIVPPWLPWPVELVWLSGVFEILGGVGLIVPPVRGWAGVGLLWLLVAVYPANIHMAINDVPFQGYLLPWWGHLIRLALQFVLMGWVVWAAELRSHWSRLR